MRHHRIHYLAGIGAILVLILFMSWHADREQGSANFERVGRSPPSPLPNPLIEISRQGGSLALDDQSPDQIIIKVALSDVVLTDEVLPMLVRSTHTKKLDLVAQKITDRGLKSLGELIHLQTLRLDETQVTDQGLTCLKGLSRLQNLSLAFTFIDGSGLGELRGLRELAELDLSNTRLDDKGLRNVQSLTNLQKLKLHGCKHLTGKGVGSLKG